MNLQHKRRMSVDEFLVWADGRDGRYELIDGEVVAMSPERLRHVRAKVAVMDAVRAAIRAAHLPCEALLDGVAVRIDAGTSYVPDVLVHCSEDPDPDSLEVAAPIIVVEVVSPSTRSIDTNRKLDGYFRVPSVTHYLVVEPARRMVIHHRRVSDGSIEARIVTSGVLDLTPPGFSLAIADLFAVP